MEKDSHYLAVEKDLIEHCGFSSEKADALMQKYYVTTRKAWGLDISIEHFADEMIRSHEMLTRA